MEKMCCKHTVGFIPAVRKNEMKVFAGKCVVLERTGSMNKPDSER